MLVTQRNSSCTVISVSATMNRFDFLLGLVLAKKLLQHTNSLSKTLQTPLLTASEGQQVADFTCMYFTSARLKTLKHLTFFGINFK